MKSRLLIGTFLVVVTLLASGFMIREKEETLHSDYIVFQSNRCFTKFVSKMKNLDAVIFIPEHKVELAKKYKLLPLKKKRASEVNRRFVKSFYKHKSIKPRANPGNDCSEPVTVAFNDLEMKVFVRKRTKVKMGEDVAVTPVPLPIPYPILGTNSGELSWKFNPVDELQFKVDNESDLTAKLRFVNEDAIDNPQANQDEFSAKIKGNWYVPVRVD